MSNINFQEKMSVSSCIFEPTKDLDFSIVELVTNGEFNGLFDQHRQKP